MVMFRSKTKVHGGKLMLVAACLVVAAAENVSGDFGLFAVKPINQLTSSGDERRPTCRGCETRGYICQWGLKASFHPSRSLRLSTPDRATLLSIERGRRTKTHEARGNHLTSPLEPSTSIVSISQLSCA
jgi:hypothetical protein